MAMRQKEFDLQGIGFPDRDPISIVAYFFLSS